MRRRRIALGPRRAFFSGLMDVLGYKANREGCRRVAAAIDPGELLRIGKEAEEDAGSPAAAMEAVLLGIAGLLPTEAPLRWDAGSRERVRRLWSVWWRYRETFGARTIEADAWRLGGIRPANHPQRRLAAAAVFLAGHPDPDAEMLERILAPGTARRAGNALRDMLCGLRDPFWERHSRIGARPGRTSARLVGPTRAEDAVVNLFLPWLLTLAWARDDEALASRIREIYLDRPPAQENSVLRFTVRRLFPESPRENRLLKSAAAQQGILQIFHDFCVADRSGCRRCPFPEWLEKGRSPQAPPPAQSPSGEGESSCADR